jgi:AbrB family looped-hinge helix DNA binding protein
MSKVYATLTSKGQMTLPRAVRDAWNLKPGDRVAIEVDGPDAGRIAPARRRSIFEGIDALSVRIPEGLTQDAIDEAIDEGPVGDAAPARDRPS